MCAEPGNLTFEDTPAARQSCPSFREVTGIWTPLGLHKGAQEAAGWISQPPHPTPGVLCLALGVGLGAQVPAALALACADSTHLATPRTSLRLLLWHQGGLRSGSPGHGTHREALQENAG